MTRKIYIVKVGAESKLVDAWLDALTRPTCISDSRTLWVLIGP